MQIPGSPPPHTCPPRRAWPEHSPWSLPGPSPQQGHSQPELCPQSRHGLLDPSPGSRPLPQLTGSSSSSARSRASEVWPLEPISTWGRMQVTTSPPRRPVSPTARLLITDDFLASPGLLLLWGHSSPWHPGLLSPVLCPQPHLYLSEWTGLSLKL